MKTTKKEKWFLAVCLFAVFAIGGLCMWYIECQYRSEMAVIEQTMAECDQRIEELDKRISFYQSFRSHSKEHTHAPAYLKLLSINN